MTQLALLQISSEKDVVSAQEGPMVIHIREELFDALSEEDKQRTINKLECFLARKREEIRVENTWKKYQYLQFTT